LRQTLIAAGVPLADQSDTEVLFKMLQRDGVAATLDKIDGMFAFAFYESKTGRLHLARDRFGEKPLYWAEANGRLIFGSEPRAVLAHPDLADAEVDPGAVALFLNFEYLPGDRSLRRGLRKLRPGSRLVFEPGRGATVSAYWQPDPDEFGRTHENVPEADKLDRLDALLEQAIRDRLIADVPVGVFLSGGVDSSLVAAIAAKHAPQITAFTIGMPEASYDETIAARRLAQTLGLRHEVFTLDDDALLAAFHQISARMDEPLADASLLPTWVLCRAVRRYATVALGGDGIDELFAGYISFKANRAAKLLSVLPTAAGRFVRGALRRLPQSGGYMAWEFLIQQLSMAAGLPPSRQWQACMAPFADEELDTLWRPEARAAAQAALCDPVTEMRTARGDRTWNAAELLHLFTSTYLPEDILQKVDRASMYVSLEVRAPYLARGFAEYAMSLPSDDKIKGFETKRLFKKLALRHLPRDIVMRRKHGFAIPLARMLRGPLKEPVGEAILGENSPLRAWFSRQTVERLWSEHNSGRRDHRKKIWTLFTLATAVANTTTKH
jgi:asparagine synthase (glutamine-hydrolysing)